MGRKRVRILDVKHMLVHKSLKLSNGNQREYVYDQYFISTFIHIPKGWYEEGCTKYKLIAVDEARSFILIPVSEDENPDENRIKILIKALRSFKKRL